MGWLKLEYYHVGIAVCAERTRLLFFFFQAEDGIRDYKVTGVQTCALPIFAEDSILQNFGQFESLYSKFTLVWSPTEALRLAAWLFDRGGKSVLPRERIQIGRASCRERV